ncbi:oligosaccharide flippase family protein [Bacillus infantis]|uniref:oligosaccharide flippase family protein n=1 Tax=Bacillus infantis TaxID=324767 RepID=UPI00209FBFE9|nr:oligosaccharide flippase family protein [Bacillus infantis]MCP1160720.1 oligosaccharide flippase family protein [Bacillus infantis]
MKKLLFKNFSWSIFGSSIYALSQWLLIIIIMRFGSPYDAGVYSLGLAICAPLVMLANLNFRALQSTNLSMKMGFNSFKRIRVFGLLFIIGFLFVYLVVSGYNNEIFLSLFLMALCKIIESCSDLYYGLFQYNERLDIVSKSTIFRGLFGTISFGIAYIITGKLTVALFILLLVWTLNLIFYDYKKSKQFLEGSFSKKVSRDNVISLIKMGIPIGLVAFLGSLSVNIPRIVFEKYLTLEDLGYFTSIFYLILVIGKFMTSLSSAVLPKLARLYEEQEMKLFLKIFKVILLILLIISSFLILLSYYFGDDILTILYGNEYKNYKFLLLLVMIYGSFNYFAFSLEIGLNAMRGYKFRLYIEILATMLVLFLSVNFIPNYGVNGGVYALIFSALLKATLLSVLFFSKYLTTERSVQNY